LISLYLYLCVDIVLIIIGIVRTYFESRPTEEILFMSFLSQSKVAKKAKNNETFKVILVITLNRLLIFSRSAKVLHNIHWLNLKTLRSEGNILEV
jgi:hypothetical protein